MTSRLFEISKTLQEPVRKVLVELIDGFDTFNSQTTISETNKSTEIIGAEITDFTRLCSEVIDKEQDLNSIGDRIIFRESFSISSFGENELKKQFNVDGHPNDIISFKILKRTPGTVKGTNIPHDSRRRETTPHLREIRTDENNPGYKSYIYGQWFDNTIEMVVWSLNNNRANKTALWLEKTMYKWKWYFLINGVPFLLYQGRGEDNSITESSGGKEVATRDIRLFNRPLIFYVRTDDLHEVKEKDLESIFINLQVYKTE